MVKPSDVICLIGSCGSAQMIHLFIKTNESLNPEDEAPLVWGQISTTGATTWLHHKPLSDLNKKMSQMKDFIWISFDFSPADSRGKECFPVRRVLDLTCLSSKLGKKKGKERFENDKSVRIQLFGIVFCFFFSFSLWNVAKRSALLRTWSDQLFLLRLGQHTRPASLHQLLQLLLTGLHSPVGSDTSCFWRFQTTCTENVHFCALLFLLGLPTCFQHVQPNVLTLCSV